MQDLQRHVADEKPETAELRQLTQGALGPQSAASITVGHPNTIEPRLDESGMPTMVWTLTLTRKPS
jgi:hypothetical protein